ncbi:MAG: hypothetical protein FJ278_13530, partial [Planctomycetes bacterium]|nr:hypothetical protein [Planctomycetota bacterium]
MLETKQCECEALSEAGKAQRLREFLARLRGVPGALTPALHAAQDTFGALTQPVQQLVADELGLTLAEVYEVATFYSFFTLKPKGRHVVRVCFGTACYVRGAARVLDRLQAELRIKVGDTTEDGEFSLELCRCLGACGLAPVITVDGHIEPEVSPTGVPYILAKHREAARPSVPVTRHPSPVTRLRAALRSASAPKVEKIFVCGGTGCKSAGCDAVREAIERELSAALLDGRVKLAVTGCFGSCALGPVMLTQPDGVFYQRVRPEDAAAIVRRHVLGGKPVSRLLHSPDQPRMADISFFSRQQRLVRQNTGALDAESMDDYLAVGGFQALKKALAMKPAEVVEI